MADPGGHLRHPASNGDALGQVLARLLAASHVSAPDVVADLADEAVRGLGGRSGAIYLADYEQRRLLPLDPREGHDRDSVDIDATLAGRAFRTLSVLDSAADGGVRLWLPLVDGTDRIGVIEAVVDGDSEPLRQSLRTLASLLAELVVAKSMYGDKLTVVRRRQSMTLPAEIQWSLLPPLTLVTPHVAISGVLEPAYHIAGDSFDYALNGDVAHVLIVDAMGHGFEASVLASVAVNAYRNSRREGRSITDTYAFMDATVAREFGPDRFVTAQMAELDTTTGTLLWLNAGHPRPLQVRRDKVIGSLAGEPALPVGFGSGAAEATVHALEPGDALLFFSDGVVEARSPDGDFFGENRLADLLVRATTAGLPVAETMRRLVHAILEHQQAELQDDATVVLLRWNQRARDRQGPA